MMEHGGVRRATVIGALALCLAAAGCGAPTSSPGNEVSAADGGAIVNAAHFGDDGAGPTHSVAPAPAGLPGSSAVETTTIPAAFHGRWGLVAADCTTKNGDEKGLMTITSDRLAFYESRATVAGLELVSPSEVKADLSFSGEGQTWAERTPLVLGDNGNTLTRTTEGQTLRYTRCKG